MIIYSNFQCVVFKHMLQVKLLNTEIALWKPQNTSNYKSTSFQGMAWCHQATQAITWPSVDPSSILPYGITTLQ